MQEKLFIKKKLEEKAKENSQNPDLQFKEEGFLTGEPDRKTQKKNLGKNFEHYEQFYDLMKD